MIQVVVVTHGRYTADSSMTVLYDRISSGWEGFAALSSRHKYRISVSMVLDTLACSLDLILVLLYVAPAVPKAKSCKIFESFRNKLYLPETSSILNMILVLVLVQKTQGLRV